jgi:hypothetical protein
MSDVIVTDRFFKGVKTSRAVLLMFLGASSGVMSLGFQHLKKANRGLK